MKKKKILLITFLIFIICLISIVVFLSFSYGWFQKDIEIANHWIEKGALLQSNYGSILEQYGKDAKKTFIKLLKERKITFLGSDCHARKSVYTRVNRAVNEMEKYADMDYIDKITRLNQEKVIEDKEIF